MSLLGSDTMSGNDAITIERVDEHIAILTLNRPEERNSISSEGMLSSLLSELEALNRDETVRAIVLTGRGSAFCSGGNLKKMGSGAGTVDDLPAKTRNNYRTGIQQLPLLLERLDVPVIAAVNGAAIGAGCDLACMCDIRIASHSAVFAESFVTLGLIPGDGGAWLLPRIVGFARASELALTGRRVSADEALSIGLVTQLVPDTDLAEAALGTARLIASNAPLAVRMTRRLLRQVQHSSLDAALELSAALQAIAHATHDHREALAAFLAKRPARFEGR